MEYATAIIPARYNSRRFPGKPLALISGKPMIQIVYNRAKKSSLLNRIIIATDDKRIFNKSKDFGAESWMTSPHHKTGTERVAEIAKKIDASLIVNIQGDEPFITGNMIDKLVTALQEKTIHMVRSRLYSAVLETGRTFLRDTERVQSGC